MELKIVIDTEGAVVNKLLEVVGQFKASIRSFTVTDNPRHGTSEVSMKLSVPSNLELDKVLSQIRATRHVIKVSRS